MAVKVQPLGDRILVQPIERQEVTKGGIFLPETGQRETAGRQSNCGRAGQDDRRR